MSYNPISVRPPVNLGTSPAKIAGGMRDSFEVVMGWQNAELPSRLVIGSGDLRKLTLRIREQPLNFMIVVHQSMAIAQNGQEISRRGTKASRVLLGEGTYSVQDRQHYTEQALKEILVSASALKKDTSSIYNKFRLLRSVMFDIHVELDKITDKRERLDFLARLSRFLSKDVRACEDLLLDVHQKLEDIEKSLNLMTRWWQNVESEAKYLQRNGESSLAQEGNKIRLKDIKEGFKTLETYFAEYLDKMCELYDENIRRLNDSNQKYLDKVRDSEHMEVSKRGRLEPCKS